MPDAETIPESPSEFEPSPEGQAALEAVKNPPSDTIANAEATRDEIDQQGKQLRESNGV